MKIPYSIASSNALLVDFACLLRKTYVLKNPAGLVVRCDIVRVGSHQCSKILDRSIMVALLRILHSKTISGKKVAGILFEDGGQRIETIAAHSAVSKALRH